MKLKNKTKKRLLLLASFVSALTALLLDTVVVDNLQEQYDATFALIKSKQQGLARTDALRWRTMEAMNYIQLLEATNGNERFHQGAYRNFIERNLKSAAIAQIDPKSMDFIERNSDFISYYLDLIDKASLGDPLARTFVIQELNEQLRGRAEIALQRATEVETLAPQNQRTKRRINFWQSIAVFLQVLSVILVFARELDEKDA